jgi:hypothetical protein
MGTIQSTIRKRPQQEERDRKLKGIGGGIAGGERSAQFSFAAI